jgi:ABC-type glucose/galactose transport system permease subunit
VVASASQDRAPRVAVVPSTFAGGEDHFGNKVAGLSEPQPLDAVLTPSQLDALVQKAIQLGDLAGRNLGRMIAPQDWVLIEARGVDAVVTRSVVNFVAGLRRAGRITVAGGDESLAAAMGAAHPKTRFECVDLGAMERIDLPVPGEFHRTAAVPKLIQNCDKRIILAPLDRTGGMTIGKLDLFCFHPAEYAMLCGRNIVIAGMNAVSVDAVGSAVLGLDPSAQPVLREAEKRGFGLWDLEAIWVRGVDIEDARKALNS